MIKKTLFLSLFLLFSLSSFANFDFNANCIRAYEAIFDLRLNEAKSLINREKQQNPDNGIIILLENYVDYFSILASESKADFAKLKNAKNARIKALEKQNKNSPYYLFAQAEINLQVGLLKSRFQEFMSSGMDMKRADNLLSENAKKFPSFLPNKKSAALIDVVFGSLPSNLRGVLSTIGISGNTESGIRTLESLMSSLPRSSYAFYRDEVAFFLCYIETSLVHNKANHNKTMAFAATLGGKSLLRAYLQGFISARNGHNDSAISFFQKRPTGEEYVSFPLINYYLGSAKLNRMDNDAHQYLVNFLKGSADRGYVKDAYLKLAYYYFIRGDQTRYQTFISQVKSQGSSSDEKDKQALKEANEPAPDMDLLKARLYFDGGYYQKALAELADKDYRSFKLKRDQIEFYYRLGRIYDELGRDSDALISYQRAINEGRTSTYYFAANAALNAGLICEKKNDKSKAADFFKQAIAMKNHEYENSIETRAKDGLKRLGAH